MHNKHESREAKNVELQVTSAISLKRRDKIKKRENNVAQIGSRRDNAHDSRIRFVNFVFCCNNNIRKNIPLISEKNSNNNNNNTISGFKSSCDGDINIKNQNKKTRDSMECKHLSYS